MGIVGRISKKIKKIHWFPFYNTFYEKVSVDDSIILMESRSGKGLESNIFALIRELQKEPYARYRIYLSAASEARDEVREKLQTYGVKVDKILIMGSFTYYYYLSKAAYLVNDTSFPGRFIKKEGQIYLNTWHGTPLKKMGADNPSEKVLMGNVMRNLLMSDYLLFPNQYMQEKMTEAYMLDNLYKGEVLLEGYPRNALLLQDEDREVRREGLSLQDKKVYIYMPTFRGRSDQVDREPYLERLEEIFHCWDARLNEDEVILVKLHPFLGTAISLENFSHIKPFPANHDTYDVLRLSDGLITDYSSVFYDYANTNKKIVLFPYDYEEYAGGRGMYEDIREYPFPVVREAGEAVDSLRREDTGNLKEFHSRYNTWDNKAAVSRICRHVFLGESCCRTSRLQGNGKDNVLLYPGDLAQNGITTVFFSTLDDLDKTKHNYYVSFRMEYMKDCPDRIDRIPEGIGIYPMASEMSKDLLTVLAHFLYLELGIKSPLIINRLHRAYRREWRKHFGFSDFRHALQYNGYETYTIMLMAQAPCRKGIWVHNDMEQEIRLKGNQNIHLLRDSYPKYNYVVAVSEDAADSVKAIAGDEVNLQVIENPQNYQAVKDRAEKDIVFGKDTLSTVSLEKLRGILDGPGMKFISIGRYSVEKGHERLIKAFEEYYGENPNSWLIIIGGTGNLYEQTVALAAAQKSANHIILIKTMDNPMPVLKKCDLFLLPSLYEGQGLVMAEADILQVPVAGCNVKGARNFLEKYGGTLLEDSQEGILRGMERAGKEQLPLLRIDYQKRNEESIKAVEKLLS